MLKKKEAYCINAYLHFPSSIIYADSKLSGEMNTFSFGCPYNAF